MSWIHEDGDHEAYADELWGEEEPDNITAFQYALRGGEGPHSRPTTAEIMMEGEHRRKRDA